jgi:putative phosphoribosyl transferase
MDARFRDRAHAGQVLAAHLDELRGRKDAIVLALPRGGVPVGYEVAVALGVPLDVFVVRKLGVPGHRELAMGAIASGGTRVLNEQVVSAVGATEEIIDAVAAEEERELLRREGLYRGDRPPPQVVGRTVVIVDDGLATGATMRAAAAAVRELGPAALWVAVPVAARPTCEELRPHVDAVVCTRMPDPFQAVGLWYEDFSDTTDDEIRELLRLAEERNRVA